MQIYRCNAQQKGVNIFTREFRYYLHATDIDRYIDEVIDRRKGLNRNQCTCVCTRGERHMHKLYNKNKSVCHPLAPSLTWHEGLRTSKAIMRIAKVIKMPNRLAFDLQHITTHHNKAEAMPTKGFTHIRRKILRKLSKLLQRVPNLNLFRV